MRLGNYTFTQQLILRRLLTAPASVEELAQLLCGGAPKRQRRLITTHIHYLRKRLKAPNDGAIITIRRIYHFTPTSTTKKETP